MWQWQWLFPWFSPPGVTLRRAIMLDAPRIAAIHAEGFAIGWGTAEIERMLLEGHVADVLVSRGFLGGVVMGGVIMGFAISRVVLDEAELLTIALDREARGRGHGARLLRHHLARVRQAGATALLLEVAADNAAALRLYRGMGFEEFGRRKGYYPGRDGTRRDAVTMRLGIAHLDPTPRPA